MSFRFTPFRIISHHPSLSRRYSTKPSSLHDQLRSHIQPHVASLRSSLSHRTRHAVSSLAKSATLLGLKLNEVTGYEQVELLKAQVAEQERVLERARTAARQAKVAYDLAVARRSSAQREVNSLLERKHAWTDADVSSFTTLVRADHSSTAEVTATSANLKEQEIAVDKAFSDLTNAILQRYHEEQVWSDKIRSVSTWANVVGLIFNFLIFVIAIAIVEPWKRRRLVARVEERMSVSMEKVQEQIEALRIAAESTAKLPLAPDSVSFPQPQLEIHTAPFPEPHPSSSALVSDLLQKHLDMDIPLTPEQSHLISTAVGIIAGCVISVGISSLLR